MKPEDFFFQGLDKAGNTSNKHGPSANLVSVQKIAGLNTLGLIHFQFNIGAVPAVAIASVSSQNPGLITIANPVLASNPSISDDVLAKAFQLDKQTVDWLQAQF
ncbi:hypothetical protein LUZ60_009017 [Juncus effusus]|nr:hypothetical protein LUZ60_009017 [Juncus effusus]